MPWTNALASISAVARDAVRPGNVAAIGKVLRTTNGFAVSIEGRLQRRRGHARAARRDARVPAPWRKTRSSGLAVGIVAVQGLNILRVISLFYLGQWNRRCSSGRTCTCGRR